MTILKEFETKNEISNAGIAISSYVLSINDDEDLKKMTKKELIELIHKERKGHFESIEVLENNKEIEFKTLEKVFNNFVDRLRGEY